MRTEDDIVDAVLAYNKTAKEKEVRDLIRVISQYLKQLVKEDKHELIELPYTGYLYRKLNTYSEKEQKSEMYIKKYLRSIYKYGIPYQPNYYVNESFLKTKYNAKTKDELTEALNNPSFKI